MRAMEVAVCHSNYIERSRKNVLVVRQPRSVGGTMGLMRAGQKLLLKRVLRQKPLVGQTRPRRKR